MKKSLLIIVIMCTLSFLSCSKTENTQETNNVTGTYEESSIIDETDSQNLQFEDSVPEMDLEGYQFRILSTGELHAWHGVLNIEEETGDPIDDSIYRRNRIIEERFNITMSETYDDWAGNNLKKSVKAGSDDYDFVTGWCDPMLVNFTEGLGYKFSDYGEYIDLSKPYWDSGLTQSFTFKDTIIFPVGAVDITTYDLIHVLLFNKQLVADLGLESPYSLVKDGTWTFDKYAEMAKLSVHDADGNGTMDENDSYGLVSMVKYVLPCFWVAADVRTIAKSNDGLPEFTLAKDERFASVIQKIFEITYDNNSWYRNPSDRANHSTVHDTIFMDNRALFYNNTFKMIEDIRSMETDFGIIPYPKYTGNQTEYYTRMEGCFPFIVPITVPEPVKVGAIIEAMACESLNYIIPAYYEVSLKTKYARDEESAEMLDIIFSNRVIDLGDSIWCSILRDGVFVDMFAKDDRNLTSRLEKIENQVNRAIDKATASLDLE